MSEQMQIWLEFSGTMLRGLLPKGAGAEAFGAGMAAHEFAAMVDRESARVDHALVALATAANDAEVKHLFGQLSKDTVMVLMSRWVHYTQRWRDLLTQPNAQHWFPPDQKDWWRAIFLSMTGENWYSTETARPLWPEAF